MVDDGGEEDEEELSGGEEADLRSSSGRGSLLTRRGITLRVLLKDGLVEPGDGILSIHYLVISIHMSHKESSQTPPRSNPALSSCSLGEKLCGGPFD